MTSKTLMGNRAGAATAVVLLLMTPVGAPPAHAQQFAELEARLQSHPELAATRFESAARRDMSLAARALPDPVVSIGVNNVPISDPAFDRVMMTHKALGIRQQFPSRELREARAARAEREAGVGEIAEQWRFAELRAMLIGALADKARAREQLALARERDEKYSDLAEVVANEIESGRPVVFRAAQIDVERAGVASELAELEGELARVDALLVSLVGIAADAPPPALPTPVNPANDEDFYVARLAAADIDVAAAGVDEARATFRPEWGVSLTWQQRESGGSRFDGDDWFSAQLNVSVPIWARKSQTPRLRAASAKQSAARSDYEAAVRTAQWQWTSLQASAAAAASNQKVLGARIRAIDDAQRAAAVNYEAGIGDYTPVLDADIARLRLRGQLAAERAKWISLVAQAQSMRVSP